MTGILFGQAARCETVSGNSLIRNRIHGFLAMEFSGPALKSAELKISTFSLSHCWGCTAQDFGVDVTFKILWDGVCIAQSSYIELVDVCLMDKSAFKLSGLQHWEC